MDVVHGLDMKYSALALSSRDVELDMPDAHLARRRTEALGGVRNERHARLQGVGQGISDGAGVHRGERLEQDLAGAVDRGQDLDVILAARFLRAAPFPRLPPLQRAFSLARVVMSSTCTVFPSFRSLALRADRPRKR
jgi:hypothetical protein